MSDLSNQVIFLTGGARGIGYECVKAYLQQGASVAVVDREVSPLEAVASNSGGRLLAMQADVTRGTDIQKAIEQTLSTFGKLNAIHNNVGLTQPSKALHETSEEEFDLLIRVNLKSIYYTTQFGIEALKQSKGTILHTSSMVGAIGQERHAAYSATKGGVDALTKSMALDYAPFGIRVNAVSPAGVWTEALRAWADSQADKNDIEHYLDQIHALGYCPQGDVIADACVFLLSDKARFITGCVLPVSGGAELGYKK